MLPAPLADALWAHAAREAPHECVGALGGHQLGPEWRVVALYPLRNISPQPRREYLADPGHLVRALKAMHTEGLSLVALYHSHPHGPARPSLTDTRLAAYPVPYLIADLSRRELSAYQLPGGEPVPVLLVPAAPPH